MKRGETIGTAQAIELPLHCIKWDSISYRGFCVGVHGGGVDGQSAEAGVGWLVSLIPVKVGASWWTSGICLSPCTGIAHVDHSALPSSWVIVTRIWVLLVTQQVPCRPSHLSALLNLVFWSLSWLDCHVHYPVKYLREQSSHIANTCFYSAFSWY